MNLHKILVAIDFSRDSELAISAALDVAKAGDAKLTLLHVCEPIPYSTPDVSLYVPSPEMMADLLADARGALEVRKARCSAAGVKVETALVTGSPAAEIVRYAAEHDFDLIVVGSHGRRGFRRLVLGSVAEAVVRTADRPVLTTHRPEAAATAAGAA